ncbi:MAG: competence protein [Hyphomicrobiales bacterium]|nr:competence protein [Hyphomicrobiales bacterium]
MQYAMLGNQKCEAAPGLYGECRGCENRVLAKCGTQRVWHWAHIGKISCNFEREPETEWHRNWKNQFASEWREVIRRAENGERHIADVMTEHGLVIEFQHSPLHPNERVSRETFHPNMVWIVDGTRLKRTWSKFLQGQQSWRSTHWQGYFLTHFPEESFPIEWLASSVPVFFDFSGLPKMVEDQSPKQKTLWLLLPGRAEGRAVILAVSRQSFIDVSLRRSQILDTKKILQEMADLIALQRSLEYREFNRQRLNFRRGKRFARRRYPKF